MTDPRKISTSLSLCDDGIYRPASISSVSYPDEGNSDCMQIEDASFWFQHRNKVIVDLIRTYSKNATDFLDIGGGNGCVSQAIEDYGLTSTLIEPGHGVTNAKKRNVTHIIQGTLDDAKIKPNTIQNTGLFDVLEHIADDATLLEHIHQVLQPSGKLYITVPAFMWLWSSEDMHAGHYRRYTVKTLSSALRHAGFSIEICTYFFRPLVLPIFLTRTLASAVGFRKQTNKKTMAKEHGTSDGFLTKLINGQLSAERTSIRKGKEILFGSSVLAVATKE